jgi:hypothetical protein
MENYTRFEAVGPFVPIFMEWWRVWKIDHCRYVMTMKKVFGLIRPDFLYVTASMIDDGIEGMDFWFKIIPCNLLVISQGGKGHIPTLSWLRTFHPEDFPISQSYEYDAVFCGTIKNHWLRSVTGFSMMNTKGRFLVTKTDQWRAIYSASKFVMAPRGWGRNSYRFGEVLQMGMIPVFVYNDVPWVPYYDCINWSRLAVVVHVKDVRKTLNYLRNCPVEHVNQMRLNVRAFYESHFHQDAVWRHFQNFLLKGFRESDLRCAKYYSDRGKELPKDLNGWDKEEARYIISHKNDLRPAEHKCLGIVRINLWQDEVARSRC